MANYTDKEMLNDALSSQKMLTNDYNTVANECSDPNVKAMMINILQDEHTMQHEAFEEMKKRGWYQVEAADVNKITQAKTKFQNMC